MLQSIGIHIELEKSRFDTVAGRPDAIYYLPENFGGCKDLKMHVPDDEMEYVQRHIIADDDFNEYRCYFHYIMNELSLSCPNNCEEALSLYENLLCAECNGI